MIVAKKAARALPAAALKTVSDAIEAHLAAVEALTKFLDEIDGDHDMEPYLAGFHLLDDDREEDAGEDDFLQRGVL